MDDILSVFGLFKSVWEKGGWFGLFLLLLLMTVFVVIWEIFRTFIPALITGDRKFTGFAGWIQRAIGSQPTNPDLMKHNVFVRIESMRLKIQDMSIDCKLRKKLFVDLLMEQMTAIKSCLEVFLKELPDTPPANIKLAYELLFHKIERTWRAALEAKGYPESAVLVYKRESSMSQRMLDYAIIDLLTNSTCIQTQDKPLVLLDVMTSMVCTNLMVMEKALAEANGEISGLTYQGIKCTECDPQCKYSKNHMAAMHKLEVKADMDRTRKELAIIDKPQAAE